MLVFSQGFPHSSVGKEFTCNSGDTGSIPGSGRSAGEGNGYPLQYSWASLVAHLVKNSPTIWETWVGKIPWRRERFPLQYSGLENSMDYIDQGVAKSWTQVSDFHFTSLQVYYMQSTLGGISSFIPETELSLRVATPWPLEHAKVIAFIATGHQA